WVEVDVTDLVRSGVASLSDKLLSFHVDQLTTSGTFVYYTNSESLDVAHRPQLLMSGSFTNTAAPVAVNDQYLAGNDGAAIQVSTAKGVLANDTDAEIYPRTAELVSGPTHGSLTLNADGSFSYTPRVGYVGSDSFTYQARDYNQASNTATV